MSQVYHHEQNADLAANGSEVIFRCVLGLLRIFYSIRFDRYFGLIFMVWNALAVFMCGYNKICTGWSGFRLCRMNNIDLDILPGDKDKCYTYISPDEVLC
ncbi:hypothetical protein NDU88_007529 [Pleurodeles waltl]|uniref:Uncharacterized protein n=1 Tax=Pleurodeles waltl TaxID=8319 RepID=A0AAV7PLP2_PLEWA|nr:hypothetical protein NDU88_007529 [Pleurodeles waltl]